MTIEKHVTHVHAIAMPLPQLMEYILTTKALLNVPSDVRVRLEVVDNDDAGYQVVTLSWQSSEPVRELV